VTHEFSDYLQQLRAVRRSAQRVAFFDLDRTLIASYSALPLLYEQLKGQKIGFLGALQQLLMALGQSRGAYDFEEVAGKAVAMIAGCPEKDFQHLGDLLFHKHLRKRIYSEAQELIDAHRSKGHRVVLVTSATRYQAQPVAEALELDDILCTELEVAGGKLTGVIRAEACWGDGKRRAAQRWCQEADKDLGRAFFYSDSLDDLPLFEAVESPVAINPDSALQRHALAHNWPVCKFRSRARATPLDLVRTAAVYGAMVPSLAAGKIANAIGAVNREEAALQTFTRYAELALELAGVRMEIKNEQYLWEQRPAIFVINHQSMLDGYITPALVKRDYFMMGKKEAGNIPVLGQMLKDAGFILFDRSDRDAAIAACDDAAERIKQGYSLCIAPEGTRSYSRKLEPFKKGAFHIALQTGAPIVPIVAKNATEFWPRGQQFVRPGTLKVEILKPVSTRNWNRENLDEQLSKLQQRFARALDTAD